MLWFSSGAFCANTNGFATEEKADSVYEVRIKDSLQIIRLIDNGFQKVESDDSPQAKEKFFSTVEDAIQIARKTGLLVMTGKKVNSTGKRLRNEARYSIAIWLHKKGIAIGKETGNTKLLIFSYNDLGVVFRRIDSYQKAMEYHLKALRLATQIHDSASRAIAVNSIGNVNIMLGNYDKAFQYFKQSLRLEQNRNNPIGIAINMNNIAHIYEKKGQLTKALRYYELSLDINRKINSTRGIAICSNDIARILKKQGKYQDALIFAKSALWKSKEVKDYASLASAYIETGELYSTMKDTSRAFQYLMPGIELAKKIRARATLQEGYHILFNTYMEMENYKEAIKYLKLKQVYHDSLLNLNIRKSIARLQIQFDTERQKSQMHLQQQKTKIAILQLKKQKYLLYFAWSAFAILLIILAFVSFYLYNKSKQNQLLIEKNRKIKATQQELKKSNTALHKAIKEAENSTQAKTDFLANISHEIRTPLNSVIGFSDLLFSMTNDDTQKNYLRAIKSGGESLLSLINDILDLSKIEEGNIDLEFKETDIRKIIDDMINIFSLEASDKSLHLAAEIDENIPQNIIFEEARLRQILFNIIGNAIKFTKKGSVDITARAEPEDEKERIRLIIEVTDTGSGISTDEQKLIFIPFHQGQTNEKANGTGLGLAICQRLANAMNGEITLQSSPGKGSRFSVIFHDVLVGKNTVSSSEVKASSRKADKKCLFINQPHAFKDELKQVFVSHGFEVTDVGLNLSLARKNISDFRLIVFCCLEEEVLQNARNIFEKENLDKQYLFLILNINNSFPIDQIKASSIDLFNQPVSEVKQALREFIRQFDEDECARQLFNLQQPGDKQEFLKEIRQLYVNHFEPALNTKMFDKIEVFTQQLQQIATGYQLQNLIEYADDLSYHLKDFNIVAIEKQLRIFKKAFEAAFNKK
jgi:signal transduction histidine kinase